jgi:hypothetical protein
MDQFHLLTRERRRRATTHEINQSRLTHQHDNGSYQKGVYASSLPEGGLNQRIVQGLN